MASISRDCVHLFPVLLFVKPENYQKTPSALNPHQLSKVHRRAVEARGGSGKLNSSGNSVLFLHGAPLVEENGNIN